MPAPRRGGDHDGPRAAIRLLFLLAAGTLGGALDYLLLLDRRPSNFTALGWLALVGTHAAMALVFRAERRHTGERRTNARIALALSVVSGGRPWDSSSRSICRSAPGPCIAAAGSPADRAEGPFARVAAR